jgi:tetratricopeptide (TPR) repeat protein
MWPRRILAGALAFGCAGTLVATGARGQESVMPGVRAAANAAPNDPAAALALGRALRRAGRLGEALVELRRGAALQAGPPGDTAIQLRWEAARAFVQKREVPQALASCRAVGALRATPGGKTPIPGAAAASHACAAEAHLLWKRASEVLAEATLALEGGNKSYEAKVAEGLAHELEVKDADAEASFRQAIAWRPDGAEAHSWLGRLLVRTLKHDDGVSELRRAVALDPTSPELCYELALTLPSGPEAEGLLTTAVHERPTYALAWLHLANVQLDENKLAEARASADACIKNDPREPAAQITAGRVALAEGRFDDAVRFGQAAVGLLANSARARLLVADAYAKKGDIDLAVENYQAASGLDQGDPTPLVRASEECHRQGRDTSARAFGEKATKDFPQWAPGWVAYGDALAAEKELAAARAAYESALKASGPIDAGAVQKKLAALK